MKVGNPLSHLDINEVALYLYSIYAQICHKYPFSCSPEFVPEAREESPTWVRGNLRKSGKNYGGRWEWEDREYKKRGAARVDCLETVCLPAWLRFLANSEEKQRKQFLCSCLPLPLVHHFLQTYVKCCKFLLILWTELMVKTGWNWRQKWPTILTPSLRKCLLTNITVHIILRYSNWYFKVEVWEPLPTSTAFYWRRKNLRPRHASELATSVCLSGSGFRK